MFCPTCGTENSIGLPYCNRCGANLNIALIAQPEPIVVNLTKPILIIGTALTLITLGGFGMLIAGAAELAHNVQLGGDPVIATIVMGMITILTTDFFLVRQLSKLIDASLKLGSPKSSKAPTAVATSGPPLPLLSTSPHSPASSVTDRTTRFFEPAYRAPSEVEGSPTLKNNKD